MTTVIDKLIRYVDHADVVLRDEYPILKFTPCGAWIDVYGKKRFVLAGTWKQFAHVSDERAKESFFSRKHKQLRILNSRIEAIERSISALKEGRIADYSAWAYFD